jgi:hypothetical protein
MRTYASVILAAALIVWCASPDSSIDAWIESELQSDDREVT